MFSRLTEDSPMTDDLRIRSLRELTPPSHLLREFPIDEKTADLVQATRRAAHSILHGEDDRLLVIVGPCSIHDPRAAIDYAGRLAALRKALSDDLEVVMRVYFEKPRTTIGWKGLINDPDLDGSFNINHGLRIARELLLDINSLGVPAGVEFLDQITPQYITDLVSWGAVGARTTESQGHRELASGLSCPVGFKNGTSGNVQIAVDAVRAARHSHSFLAVTKGGCSAIAETTGNPDAHIILRGGTDGTNYDSESLRRAMALQEKAGIYTGIMVDASHANSRKDHRNQPLVCEDLAAQLRAGSRSIAGVMIESNLVEGRQDCKPGSKLVYGQSITDGCIGWEDTARCLETLAQATRARRAGRPGWRPAGQPAATAVPTTAA